MTFHKAFDQVRDPFEALETLILLGVDRILTSGGRDTAFEGIPGLAALVGRAKGRLVVMAGGRLDADSVPRVIREGHVDEVHLASGVGATDIGGSYGAGRRVRRHVAARLEPARS